jgi:hypothetical protein
VDHNFPGHLRMYRTEIFVGASALKCEREFIIGVERLGFKLVVHADNRVRNVVFISPYHLTANSDRKVHRGEAEVVDANGCWRERRGRRAHSHHCKMNERHGRRQQHDSADSSKLFDSHNLLNLPGLNPQSPTNVCFEQV